VRRLWLAVAVLALASEAAAEGGETILVRFADGSSLPLRSWSFSYEYSTLQRGESPALATTARKDAREIWAGKRAIPVAGLTLEIQYSQLERSQEVEGEIRPLLVAVAKGLSIMAADGKRTVLKQDPPHRDLLAPGLEGTIIVQARSLDLRGQTLTGTRRDLCLLSYSALVQCSSEADQRVVKIQFPP
jgi:hypothetical protein